MAATRLVGRPAGYLSPGRANGAASVGKYTEEMEEASPRVDDPPHRSDWPDD